MCPESRFRSASVPCGLSDSSPVMHTEIRLGSDQYTRRPLASPLDRCDHGSFSGHLFERDPWLAFGR